MNTHYRIVLACCWVFMIVYSIIPVRAQRNMIFDSQIKTLRIVGGETGPGLPILSLGSNEQLTISFDEMSHNYKRYEYRIQHLDYAFKPEPDLLENDFVNSDADYILIEDYRESRNTVVNYTHYSFSFPNKHIQPLIAGNYALSIYANDGAGEHQEVARVYFAIVTPQVNIGTSVSTNTDIDWNASHQQVGLKVNLNSLIVRDATEEIKTFVLQNGRWDNAVLCSKPSYINGQQLIWDHARDLIFPAGNEYRAFEMLSSRYPGMGIEKMQYFAPFYHATLFTDYPNKNYLYVQDTNGKSVIRNDDNTAAETESEYILTHFSLAIPAIEDAQIYLQGDWTYDQFLPDYELTYNASTQLYECAVLLKTGYYSYQYLVVPNNTTKGQTGPIEGNFFQTDNAYTTLVYYKRTGDRYWQLVGTNQYRFKTIR